MKAKFYVKPSWEWPWGVTVQKVCRVARDEGEVREILDVVWENPGGREVLARAMERNKEVYDSERMLEEAKD